MTYQQYERQMTQLENEFSLATDEDQRGKITAKIQRLETKAETEGLEP